LEPAQANSSLDPILKIPNTHTHTHTPEKKKRIPNTKKGWWSGSSGRVPA
jgi:hypothetical protein